MTTTTPTDAHGRRNYYLPEGERRPDRGAARRLGGMRTFWSCRSTNSGRWKTGRCRRRARGRGTLLLEEGGGGAPTLLLLLLLLLMLLLRRRAHQQKRRSSSWLPFLPAPWDTSPRCRPPPYSKVRGRNRPLGNDRRQARASGRDDGKSRSRRRQARHRYTRRAGEKGRRLKSR